MDNRSIITQIETAMRHMRDIVKEVGRDYVYPRNERGMCFYVYRGLPDCLIGRVLNRMGMLVSELSQFEGTGASTFASGQYHPTLFPFVIYPQTWGVLAAAQKRQDGGLTWGEALDEADRIAKNVIMELA
jgi:hypothetical protein